MTPLYTRKKKNSTATTQSVNKAHMVMIIAFIFLGDFFGEFCAVSFMQ